MEGQEGRLPCAAWHAQGAWRQPPWAWAECLLDEGHIYWHSLGLLLSPVVEQRRWTYPDLGPGGGNGTHSMPRVQLPGCLTCTGQVSSSGLIGLPHRPRAGLLASSAGRCSGRPAGSGPSVQR
jgi:hypothetical protein